jgi:hypothetical protein
MGLVSHMPVKDICPFGGGIMKHRSLLFSILFSISLVTSSYALTQADLCQQTNGPNGAYVLTLDDKQTSLIDYNLLGREVATLVNEKLAPGTYTRQWDATGFASGVYFYKLQFRDFVQTRRLILLR